jgi:hypothetical protein
VEKKDPEICQYTHCRKPWAYLVQGDDAKFGTRWTARLCFAHLRACVSVPEAGLSGFGVSEPLTMLPTGWRVVGLTSVQYILTAKARKRAASG